MQVLDVIANAIVILGMFYLTFVMALAGWFAGLRRGEAVSVLPERGSRRTSTRVQIAFVLLSLAITVIFCYLLWVPIPVPIPESILPILKISGLVAFSAGLVLTVWARRTLGRMWGISTSRQVKLLSDHELIQNGPYGWVRHPMYTGWWAAVVGLVLLYHTWLVVGLLVMSLLIFYRRARIEEKVLATRFGAQWQAYKQHTRFLIPFVY